MPVAFSYAILRHRLFDISLILRQGLKYALARRVLLSLIPAAGLLLILDVTTQPDATLAELFGPSTMVVRNTGRRCGVGLPPAP